VWLAAALRIQTQVLHQVYLSAPTETPLGHSQRCIGEMHENHGRFLELGRVIIYLKIMEVN